MAGDGRHGPRRVAGRVRHRVAAQQGFWAFLLSNGLWVVWGWHSQAYALIGLQFCLAAMSIRGARKTDEAQAEQPDGS